LDDHQDALTAKEGKVADLRQEMEGLSATGKTTTEEICQLKVDLCREVMARSSREEELAWLREEVGRRVRRGWRRFSSCNKKSLHCWLLSKPLRRCVSVRKGRRLP